MRLDFSKIWNGIITFFYRRSQELPEISTKDIHLTTATPRQSNIVQSIKQRRFTYAPPLSYEYSGPYVSTSDSSGFHSSIYDLAEIARAIDTEPYALQSIRKHREQILKEGWELAGEDEMVSYIHQRLFEIQLMSSVSFSECVRSSATNLATYATFFLVVQRDLTKSTGKPYMFHGKWMLPIAGIFPMDPTTVSVKVNSSGRPIAWKQSILTSTGLKKEVVFDASDVIVGTIDKRTGFSFGTPYILPVLDDIRTLRKIEELAEVQCYRHAFPQKHHKIGTKDQPLITYDDGTSELDAIQAALNAMPSDEEYVTDYRHSIDILGAQNKSLDLAPYLEYFERRVLAGLRLSGVDLGRGDTSNKSTSQTITKSLQDAAKDMQEILANVITDHIIIPLLFEGGFDVTHDEMVRFTFPMIDREELRAHQNHGMQAYMNNLITRTEARKHYFSSKEMGDEEDQDTQRQQDAEVASRLTKEGAAAKAAAKPSGTVANKAKPANQHGSTVKKKVTANSAATFYASCMDKILDNYRLAALSNGLTINFEALTERLCEESSGHLEPAIQEGVKALCPEVVMSNRAKSRFFKNYVRKSFERTLQPFTEIKTKADRFYLNAICSRVKDELSRLAEVQLDTAFKFGFAKCAHAQGHAQVQIGEKLVDVSERAIPYSLLISLGEEIRLVGKEENDAV